ncbi:hypothetical protein FNU76_00130 [Chitinimonas arctica]|uniref:GH18 domain-containing protein n=1 Tax=Chitinimonas arctica TaxID=2594795 RepID=A0A516S9P7_9NEIS|nr:hypothetical protein [Chitinimonas arctica]QDQ24874.1 hypothetical protein FNU76_00130 [Chitinimonas arctica]
MQNRKLFKLSISAMAAAVSTVASANPSKFLIENRSATEITVSNLTSKPVDQYTIPAGASLDIVAAAVPWKFPTPSDKHFYLEIKNRNGTLCGELPGADKRYGSLKLDSIDGRLAIDAGAHCSVSADSGGGDRPDGSGSGKLSLLPMPAIGKVVVGKHYDMKAEPIFNFGSYTLDSNPMFDYRDPKNSVSYSVSGMPKGLNLMSSGSRDFDPNYNGVIYGTVQVDTRACPAVVGSPGYYKCSLNVSAVDPSLSWGGAARAIVPLYMYDGLRSKTLTELAVENGNRPLGDIHRLNISVNAASQGADIVDLSRYFTGAKSAVSYRISDSADESPIDITTRLPVPASHFSIANGSLRSNGLQAGQIVQLTVLAKSGMQLARQTIYLNLGRDGNTGGTPSVRAPQLVQGAAAWLYMGELAGNREQYSETMRANNVRYAMPDIGWVQLKEAAKQWDTTASAPLENNYSLSGIGAMAAWYKQRDPNLKMIVTYEFDNPLRGMLATLSNAVPPDVRAGSETSQMKQLVDIVVDPINADPNVDGIQFDVEPMPTQPQAVELFKQMADRLARHGKIMQIFAFADAMNPDLALAASPLTVWLPSTYDVGLYTNPQSYGFDSASLGFSGDTQCHFRAAGINAYYTNSWCSMNYDATRYGNRIRLSARNIAPFGKVPGFGQLTSLYGVHFQLGVAGEGSAMNWTAIEVWNPQADGHGNYPSVVSNQQAIERGQQAGRTFLKFSANRDGSGRPVSQAGFVQDIIDLAREVPEIGTPASNRFNLGLAVYGLSNEKDVIGCRPGGKNETKTNCIVQLPVGIDRNSPVWNIVKRY